MQIQVEIFPSMPTRPCTFCLSLQGGSVFADFDVDEKKRVFLVRISFDGYGCCTTQDNIEKMNANDSLVLLGMVRDNVIDSKAIDQIIRAYFKTNRKGIWEEALQEHSLI
jgi:hypothetical protein